MVEVCFLVAGGQSCCISGTVCVVCVVYQCFLCSNGVHPVNSLFMYGTFVVVFCLTDVKRANEHDSTS